MSDPDIGNWSHTYDVLGQFTSQTNGNSQTVTLTYDVLGRLTGRGEPDLTSAWTYDTQTRGIGKLASTTTTAGFQSTVSYDSLGRPTPTDVTVDSQTCTTTTNYNAEGRLGTVTYPFGTGASKRLSDLGHDGASLA